MPPAKPSRKRPVSKRYAKVSSPYSLFLNMCAHTHPLLLNHSIYTLTDTSSRISFHLSDQTFYLSQVPLARLHSRVRDNGRKTIMPSRKEVLGRESILNLVSPSLASRCWVREMRTSRRTKNSSLLYLLLMALRPNRPNPHHRFPLPAKAADYQTRNYRREKTLFSVKQIILIEGKRGMWYRLTCSSNHLFAPHVDQIKKIETIRDTVADWMKRYKRTPSLATTELINLVLSVGWEHLQFFLYDWPMSNQFKRQAATSRGSPSINLLMPWGSRMSCEALIHSHTER